jgi:phospholipid/cholesterol/gamma-HCH transport system permease protein
MIAGFVSGLGRSVREFVVGVGFAGRMFINMLGASLGLLRRPRLITDQIHFIGNYSLVIITVSGL